MMQPQDPIEPNGLIQRGIADGHLQLITSGKRRTSAIRLRTTRRRGTIPKKKFVRLLWRTDLSQWLRAGVHWRGGHRAGPDAVRPRRPGRLPRWESERSRLPSLTGTSNVHDPRACGEASKISRALLLFSSIIWAVASCCKPAGAYH